MPVKGEMRKLDKKAKEQGVLGTVGNAWVRAKEYYEDLLKPIEPNRQSTINVNEDKMLAETERSSL